MLHLILYAAHAAPLAVTTSEREDAPGAAPDAPDGQYIINGESADEDLYPATGALLVDAVLDFGQGPPYDFRVLMCTSTLIAPDVVALAAHCVDEETLTYGQGTLTYNELRWTRQADLTAFTDFEAEEKADWPDDSVVVADWVRHEGFDIWSLSYGVDGQNDDVALLFLEEPVTDVAYVRLPVAEEEQALLVEGAEVDVVGWGQQTATGMGEMPPEGTYALKMWGRSVIGAVGASEVQVGPSQTDVRKCHGDSGGPTFQYVAEGELRMVGITSHAFDETDCRRSGGVDTRVDAFLTWIDAEMRARCEDGTRSWCEEEGIPTGEAPEPEEEEDSGIVADDGDDADEEVALAGGCGCASPTVTPGWLGALVALAALRRRRA